MTANKLIQSKLNKINMRLGTRVRFNCGGKVIVGDLVDKRDKTYLVDIDTINGIKQDTKTVITVTTATVLEYLFKNS